MTEVIRLCGRGWVGDLVSGVRPMTAWTADKYPQRYRAGLGTCISPLRGCKRVYPLNQSREQLSSH
jgi:hypothetical protein